MSFTYTTGIPDPPHDPSVDVPNMQTNTNSIASWVGVDHVGFNAGAGGTHQQVNFVSNATPSLNGVSQLYVNDETGLFGTMSSLFFQNASKNLPLFNIPMTSVTSGDNADRGITTPWGLILNYGFNTGGTSVTITWAVPGTHVWAVFATISSNTTGNLITVGAAPGPNGTTGTFKMASNGNGFYYLAIMS
jgi:hypothetical protein